MGYSDKEKQKEYQRNWLAKRREEFFKGKTCFCGSADRLELDHIDPTTKVYNPSSLWGMSPTNPKRIAELAKCQVLCYSCHREKTNSQIMVPREHGTHVMYMREKCRCDTCREWNRQDKRGRRIRLGY